MTGAIFTWGYAGSTIDDLFDVCQKLKITHVIDCRRKPMSRVPGFGGRQLTEAFRWPRDAGRPECVYAQRGHVLGGVPASMEMPAGGPPPVDKAALVVLAAEADAGHRLLLMCAEKAPGDCHRHMTIALPLARAGVTVRHVFEGELVEALELQRSIDAGDEDEYECTSLEDEA